MTKNEMELHRLLLAQALEAAAEVLRRGEVQDRGNQPVTSSTEPEADRKVLLTVADAAERLSIGRTKLYELMRSGTLPTVAVGRSRRIPASALFDLVTARMTHEVRPQN